MRAFPLLTLLLVGSLGLSGLNSPGAAPQPIEATDAELHAYVGVVDAMRSRWSTLDAACDPDMVFALLYLITTAKVGDLVAADHFADNGLLVRWDRDFAQRYFAAYDAYHAGKPTPEPWRIAFAHADSGKSTVMEDLLLGMNAHVNYDLSFSAYTMGLPQNGKKADYDRVNDAFWNVPLGLEQDLYPRYTGSTPPQGEEVGPEYNAVVEVLISWREAAWVNAQALANAPTSLARGVVAKSIEAEAAAIARGIAVNQEDTRASRVATCQASGHPPLLTENGGVGYGDAWFTATFQPARFLICHAPGTHHEKTLLANDPSWTGHANHGDRIGAC